MEITDILMLFDNNHMPCLEHLRGDSKRVLFRKQNLISNLKEF